MITALFLIGSLSAIAALTLPKRALFPAVSTLSTALFALAAYITLPLLAGGTLQSGVWYLDPFAALLLLIIAFLQWSATLVSVPFISTELHEGTIDVAHARRYFALLSAFIFSMMLTVAVDNLGLMWVALEATTLATTLLVSFYPRKGSLEAAWKYIVLCSTGISLGLIGLLLTYYAATVAAPDLPNIDWTYLRSIASTLSPQIMQIAFIFVLIGYGTKVGLAPMHAWLPDAHSRAPAPISAMLSGVLLNAALFAILRYKTLVDASLGGGEWTSVLLVFFGVLSTLIPAAFILVQTDYKRLLAYSSIEHMGITAILFGLGPLGAFAALVHLTGHALTKSMLFFGAGNILHAWKSTKFERVGDVMKTHPYTGGLFLFGVFALLAAPPSPLFFSEYLLFAGLISTHPVAFALVAFALLVIGAGFMRFLMPLLFSPVRGGESVERETFNISHGAMMVHAVLIVSFGVLLATNAGQTIMSAIAASIF
ncbi:MAG: hydrogenase 4 subunit F [Candidatus Kaiserbacteria bacterium]|nr:MAG: hydrogenase 4 subunit F [Candidatus Kaiserbacteria bacterium]